MLKIDLISIWFQAKLLSIQETKSGKKKKDPNAPKKPMSGYMIWLNESRESIKKEYPGISITELSKKAGEKWKELGDKTVRCYYNFILKMDAVYSI